MVSLFFVDYCQMQIYFPKFEDMIHSCFTLKPHAFDEERSGNL